MDKYKALVEALKQREAFYMPAMTKLNNTVYVSEDGGCRWVKEAYCYAVLNHWETPNTVRYIVDFPCRFGSRKGLGRHIKTGQMKEHEKVYLNWVLNKSPWKDAYLTKDWHEVEEEGCILQTLGFSAQFVVGAMVALRYLGEMPHIVTAWAEIKDSIAPTGTISLIADNVSSGIEPEPGMDERLAFVFAHKIDEYGQYSNRLSLMNHAVFGEELDTQGLKQFLSGTQRSLLSFNDSSNFRGMSKIWQDHCTYEKGLEWPAGEKGGQEMITTTLGFDVMVEVEGKRTISTFVKEWIEMNKEAVGW
jgi:hypothetical protein